MKRYLPILLSIMMVGGAALWVIVHKNETTRQATQAHRSIGDFVPQRSCARPPAFLRKLHILQPVMIDLSQKRFKGIALLYGKKFANVLHPKQWEQYEHFSTYALDTVGNIYLVPTPFISVHPTTFNLQKKLYKLDTKTGKISIWMDLENVHPDEHNPYGINAIAYDCEDKTLWVGAIDRSDYQTERGVIYHIDPRRRTVLETFEGIDALTLLVARTPKQKYLLIGSARDHRLYALDIAPQSPTRMQQKIPILALPDPNLHVRKIVLKKTGILELQAIPFGYTLVAQSDRQDRVHYEARWIKQTKTWQVNKRQ